MTPTRREYLAGVTAAGIGAVAGCVDDADPGEEPSFAERVDARSHSNGLCKTHRLAGGMPTLSAQP